MAAVVPSVSDRGWLKGPSEKADQLLSNFYATDAAQTYLYKGSVTNVQDLLQRFGNDMNRIASQMQIALDEYFKPYFDAVSVQVSTNADDDVNPTNAVTLTVAIAVVQDGKQYSVSALVGNVNSKFRRITNYINTGVLADN